MHINKYKNKARKTNKQTNLITRVVTVSENPQRRRSLNISSRRFDVWTTMVQTIVVDHTFKAHLYQFNGDMHALFQTPVSGFQSVAITRKNTTNSHFRICQEISTTREAFVLFAPAKCRSEPPVHFRSLTLKKDANALQQFKKQRQRTCQRCSPGVARRIP